MNDSPENSNFFKIILSSIADGVFTVSNDRIITSFNRALISFLDLFSPQYSNALSKYYEYKEILSFVA